MPDSGAHLQRTHRRQIVTRSNPRPFDGTVLRLCTASRGTTLLQIGRARGITPDHWPERATQPAIPPQSFLPDFCSRASSPTSVRPFATTRPFNSNSAAGYLAVSGNLKPTYVPELMPIRPSSVVSNWGIVRSLRTARTKTAPKTRVQTTT